MVFLLLLLGTRYLMPFRSRVDPLRSASPRLRSPQGFFEPAGSKVFYFE
jgi:hypothetical protein